MIYFLKVIHLSLPRQQVFKGVNRKGGKATFLGHLTDYAFNVRTLNNKGQLK